MITDPLHVPEDAADFERGYRAGLDAKPTALLYALLGAAFVAGLVVGLVLR